MNREDIIKLAEQAGFERIIRHVDDWICFTEEIEHFANLVAAAEREAILKLAETPIGEYEVIVACGTEPETKRIPRYLEGQFLIAAIKARGNT